MEDEQVPSFWGKVIRAGEKVQIPTSDEAYTFATSACLGEVKSQDRSVLRATIRTLMIDEVTDEATEIPEKTDEVVLATLIPGVCEHAPLNVGFSPLNTEVTLHADGPNDVHVAGNYIPVSDDEYEEEEEEEEEEEMNEQQLVKKLMELSEREKQ